MKYLAICLLSCFQLLASGQMNSVADSTRIFSSIMGSESKPDTVIIGDRRSRVNVELRGEGASQFNLLSDDDVPVIIKFAPDHGFIGLAQAWLDIKDNDGNTIYTTHLKGLSTRALEGENEASLSEIVEALGYQIELGWTTLANHIRPDLQGEEIDASLFVKAGPGEVRMLPVARYSPPFILPFGYYVQSENGPVNKQVGILADSKEYPEHQSLFPALQDGESSFDPGQQMFGFYTTSPSHVAYSEDIWNMLFYQDHASHAVRTFAVSDPGGETIPNTYLVCFEEASNGDYQDYVFLVSNIQPINNKSHFQSLFNGRDFQGWYKFLESKGRNHDPDRVFTVNEGIIHDTGMELGYIMTNKSYDNFHFTLKFKWGEKRWPPRDTLKRDSGICYHVPVDEPDQVWPASVECQIQEGDVGDFWMLGYSTIVIDGQQNIPARYSRFQKKHDNEHPNGEWNTVEVLSYNGQCIHIVNGMIVNAGQFSSLRHGKILLQSEYAEIYYKDILIRQL